MARSSAPPGLWLMNPPSPTSTRHVGHGEVCSEDRRKQQNRDAQRAYRRRLKQRLSTLDELETEFVAPLQYASQELAQGDPSVWRPASNQMPILPMGMIPAMWPIPGSTNISTPSMSDVEQNPHSLTVRNLLESIQMVLNQETVYRLLMTQDTDRPEQTFSSTSSSAHDTPASDPHLLSGCEAPFASTPLHQAISRGHIRAAQVLINSGASLGSTNSAGQTPLQIAACLGQIDAVNILIENASNLDHQDFCQRTALHLAVQNSQFAVVERLVSAGAYLEAVNGDGATALHLAAAGGNEDILSCLINAGADINCRTCPPNNL